MYVCLNPNLSLSTNLFFFLIRSYLRPSEDKQEEALRRACSDVIWRSAGGFNHQPEIESKAIVALPSENNYVQHSSHYYQDGVTEKVLK